jgi:hypothetical protein
MIRRLLDSDMDLVLRSGFIYVPLLFDPSVEHEILSPRKRGALIQIERRYLLKALKVESLLGNYAALWPESYERLREGCLRKCTGVPRPQQMPVDGKLRTILFGVMPHFIRGHRGLERRRLGEGEILDWIEGKVRIPARCYREASRLLDTGCLRETLEELETHGTVLEPLEDGVIPARRLGEWLHQAIERRILEREKARLREALHGREASAEAESRHLAVLLHIAEAGGFEIDRFGFSRIGPGEEYFVYRRTGEYALKDYYGRPYLFPDCRVAVSTAGRLKPFVVEKYKHPFLEGHDSGQEICLRGFNSPSAFIAATAIDALERGLNALLHGYSSRRRNGYHGLDRMTKRIGSFDWNDPQAIGPLDSPVTRRRPILDVDFEDYRVPSDHPKLASRQIDITNDLTP